MYKYMYAHSFYKLFATEPCKVVLSPVFAASMRRPGSDLILKLPHITAGSTRSPTHHQSWKKLYY